MPHVYPVPQLPYFLAKSYKYSHKETIKRTSFLSGRTRSRISSVIAPESYFLTAIMTADQLAIFEAWLLHTVKYIEPMSIPIATAADGCASKVVTLVSSAFSKEMIGTSQYKISIVVEAEKQSVMSAADLAVALS